MPSWMSFNKSTLHLNKGSAVTLSSSLFALPRALRKQSSRRHTGAFDIDNLTCTYRQDERPMAEVESGKLNICHHGLGNCTRKMIANLTTPGNSVSIAMYGYSSIRFLMMANSSSRFEPHTSRVSRLSFVSGGRVIKLEKAPKSKITLQRNSFVVPRKATFTRSFLSISTGCSWLTWPS